MNNRITFEILGAKREVTDRDLADLNRLLLQVSRKFRPIGRKQLRDALEHSFVLVARDAGQPLKRIIGMATLAPFYAINKKRAGIHHVVVDEAYRGKGIGTSLMRRLITHARKLGIARIELTSGPDRKTANKLYQKLGFEQHETNYYRLELK
jgi:GNAT superfamily N-acetyltransferase